MLDPFDGVPVALGAVSATTWIWLIAYWLKNRKKQAIQLPPDDTQSVSSTTTTLDKLQDSDVPVDTERWIIRLNRRKTAFVMSTLAAIGCNIAVLCTQQTIGWRNIFWLSFWVSSLFNCAAKLY